MTPGQVGVYGSTGVCLALKAAGLAAWTWRTMSTGWTGGVGVPSDFNVEQTGYLNGNTNYDRDASITDDFGQWRVGQAPTTGDDLPTPQDVWAYKGPGDTPDVHQTLQNIATGLQALQAEVAALKAGTDPAAFASAVMAAFKAKLGA